MNKFSRYLQDVSGNLQTATATVTVRKTADNLLATLFSDDGVTPLANPFTTVTGLVEFYCQGTDVGVVATGTFGTVTFTDFRMLDIEQDIDGKALLKRGKNSLGALSSFVATIAEMKALTGMPADHIVEVVSYYTAATPDGGGGRFKWDSASAATDNGGTIIQPTAGGVGRWLRIYSGALNIRWFGAKGDGATNDAAAIQATINFVDGLSVKGSVFFPAGTYNTGTTTLVFKNTITYFGEGQNAGAGVKQTEIVYTGTGDAVQLNNPINVSTAANVVVRDMRIRCSNGASIGACFADVGSTYLVMENVGLVAGKYGLILDQTELSDFRYINFTSQIRGGAWIVNGPEHTVGASTGFTNRIGIYNSQFNHGAAAYGIINEGGNAHVFRDNNYNGGLNHIRATGVQNLNIEGGEWEAAGSTNIVLANVALEGGAAKGPCSSVNIIGAEIVPTAAQSAIQIITGTPIVLIGNLFGNSTANKVVGVVNVDYLVAIGNSNGGGGATLDGVATNHLQFDNVVFLKTNQPINSTLATGTAPLVVASRTVVANLLVEGHAVVLTANLAAAGAAQNGKVVIEDGGAGNRNLVIYGGGERFRIDGGAAF